MNNFSGAKGNSFLTELFGAHVLLTIHEFKVTFILFALAFPLWFPLIWVLKGPGVLKRKDAHKVKKEVE